LFSGADDNGQTLAYADSKYLDVFLNGVLLVAGTDYTATTLTSVSLTTGAAASDIVEIVAYDIFSVADTVSASNGGTFDGAVTFADDATVNGAFTSQGIDDNADATAITIDSSERVLMGHTSSLGNNRQFQVINGPANAVQAIITAVDGNGGAQLEFAKGRGGVAQNNATIVQDDDAIALIRCYGADGTDLNSEAARIAAEVDGTPGSNDMPGRLRFMTTADGAASPTERMRIDSSGNVGIGTSSPTATLDTYIGEGLTTFGDFANSVRVQGGNNTGKYVPITFGGYGSYAPASIAYLVTTGTGNTKGALVFGTRDVTTDTRPTERMRISANGYLKCQGVYDQSAADSANVVVDGSGNIYRSTSALKYKQDVRDLESIDISTFRPVRYKSNIERDDQTLDHFGFIADEFHDAGLTELVSYGVVDEETGIAEVEGFRYDRMTVVLTKALQEANEKISALEARIEALENQ
jgi:hypothetical protein